MDDRVFAERVKTLFGNSPTVLVGGLSIAFIVSALLWTTSSHTLLSSWFGAQLLLAFGRVWLVSRFLSMIKSGEPVSFSNWAWLYTCTAAVSGILWGSLPWLVMDPASLTNTLIISLILFGMIAACIGAHAPFLPAFYAYAFPVGCLLALRFIVEGGDLMVVGFLAGVFLIPNSMYAVSLSRIIQESIGRRFEREKLLVAVQKKHQEAEQANLDKSRFLASASHDLRQPLHALDLYLGVLAREKNKQKHDEWLDKARQSSTVLGELLNGLLDISRLDAGSVKAEKRMVPLTPLLRECVAEFAQQAEEKGIDLRLRIQHGACAITDPMLFGRILRNLLSNAICHTESGKVLLAIRRRSGSLLVEVWDTGPGISEEEREMIFSEFYQLNNPERDREKGLGLGLAIVRRLSDLLDHPVNLRSQPGRGSCFCISLPACTVGETCVLPEADEPQHDIAGMFILLVDDDKAILDAQRSWLRAQDCEVLSASSGQEILAELARLEYARPDVIIADFRLRGEENGVMVVHALREHFSADVPAIIISGDTALDVAIMVKEANCQFLPKPVKEGQLLNALVQFVPN